MKSIICAAFCGVGKSYLSNIGSDVYKEFDCWLYQNERDFPHNYINDITLSLGKYKYIFISTNPLVLKRLNKLGHDILLVYPQNDLKSEYFNRYVGRGSHKDFLEALDTYWDVWLNELKEQSYCAHKILEKGQYLKDVL